MASLAWTAFLVEHELVHPPTVAVWTELTAALPPDWHATRRRLDEAAARQHSSSPPPLTTDVLRRRAP